MGRHKDIASPIQKKLFRESYMVSLFQCLELSAAGFADGIICSAFLGSTGLAAFGIASPIFTIMGIFCALIQIGAQKICVGSYCTGDKKRADGAVSTAIFMAVVLSAIIIVACEVFPIPVAGFLGASGESSDLAIPVAQYIQGLGFGIIFDILIYVLTPISQLNGQKKYIGISIITVIACDVVLDVIAGFLGLGMFGMGLATAVSKIVGFIILFIPLIKQKKVSLGLKKIEKGILLEIMHYGAPNTIKFACSAVRRVMMNRYVLFAAGTMGMSVLSVRNGIYNLLSTVGSALGAAVIVLSVLAVSEGNAHALGRIGHIVAKFMMIVIIPLCVLLVIFAFQAVCIYSQDNNDYVAMSVVAVRFMALELAFFSIFEAVSGYWQGLNETKTLNVVMVFTRLVFPIGLVVALGSLFGVMGIWISFPVAMLFSTLIYLIPAKIKHGKVSLFPMPKQYVQDNALKYERTISGQTENSEISEMSREIREFCLSCGTDKKKAYFIALCFEEIAFGEINYTEPKKGRDKIAEFFISIKDGEITMRVMDNCKEFDVVSFYGTQSYDPEHPEAHLGIRIVMGLAKDIRYTGMFGMNSLTICM